MPSRIIVFYMGEGSSSRRLTVSALVATGQLSVGDQVVAALPAWAQDCAARGQPLRRGWQGRL